MITDERHSIYNNIIERVSDNINTVVQAIANDETEPGEPGYQGSWKQRYPSIEDLNVLTATGKDDYLPASIEYPDRYPAIYFSVDAAAPNPALDDSECFLGILVYGLYVNRENFLFAQRELFEIQDALLSLIMHDKSMGVINGLGGLIDQVQYLGFSDFMVDRDTAQKYILGAKFGFQIAFREDYNR